MEEIITNFLSSAHVIVPVIALLLSLYTVGKGADILVDNAVSLSIQWGVPKMVLGATLVSLGTTVPEASVSVAAAIQGNPDLSLGNAIGSIIVDTGLIIGIASLIGTIPVDKMLVKRAGKVTVYFCSFACNSLSSRICWYMDRLRKNISMGRFYLRLSVVSLYVSFFQMGKRFCARKCYI